MVRADHPNNVKRGGVYVLMLENLCQFATSAILI